MSGVIRSQAGLPDPLGGDTVEGDSVGVLDGYWAGADEEDRAGEEGVAPCAHPPRRSANAPESISTDRGTRFLSARPVSLPPSKSFRPLNCPGAHRPRLKTRSQTGAAGAPPYGHPARSSASEVPGGVGKRHADGLQICGERASFPLPLGWAAAHAAAGMM